MQMGAAQKPVTMEKSQDIKVAFGELNKLPDSLSRHPGTTLGGPFVTLGVWGTEFHGRFVGRPFSTNNVRQIQLCLKVQMSETLCAKRIN